jgi:hypothetical protein
MAYFIAADKKILSLARRHSFEAAQSTSRTPPSRALAVPTRPSSGLDKQAADHAEFVLLLCDRSSYFHL